MLLDCERKESSVRRLITRCGSLLIPFSIWALLQSAIDAISRNNTNFLMDWLLKFVYVDCGLWFLYVLAEITVVVWLVDRIEERINLSNDKDGWLYVVVGGILLLLPVNVCGIGLLKQHYMFHIFGYLFSRHWRNYSVYTRKIIGYGSIILFPIAASFWMRIGNPLFFEYIDLNGAAAIAFLGFCKVYKVYLTPLLGITCAGLLERYIIISLNRFCLFLLQLLCHWLWGSV